MRANDGQAADLPAAREAAETRRVVADGAVVRRPRHAWTPTLHALLAHLSKAAPATAVPIGLDLDTETLTMLPGDAGRNAWPRQATISGLESAARLMRSVHDATASWVPPPGATWALPAASPAQVILHGDPGPWNMTWAGGIATGLFDWDFAHPGPRCHDVAYPPMTCSRRKRVANVLGVSFPQRRYVEDLARARFCGRRSSVRGAARRRLTAMGRLGQTARRRFGGGRLDRSGDRFSVRRRSPFRTGLPAQTRTTTYTGDLTRPRNQPNCGRARPGGTQENWTGRECWTLA